MVSCIAADCLLVRMYIAVVIHIDSRKARERELATFDGNRRAAGMLNPMRDKNSWHVPGGRDDTRDHSLSRSWKVKARQKQNQKHSRITTQRARQINQEHENVCLRTAVRPRSSTWVNVVSINRSMFTTWPIFDKKKGYTLMVRTRGARTSSL